jgi:hypothetical protein
MKKNNEMVTINMENSPRKSMSDSSVSMKKSLQKKKIAFTGKSIPRKNNTLRKETKITPQNQGKSDESSLSLSDSPDLFSTENLLEEIGAEERLEQAETEINKIKNQEFIVPVPVPVAVIESKREKGLFGRKNKLERLQEKITKQQEKIRIKQEKIMKKQEQKKLMNRVDIAESKPIISQKEGSFPLSDETNVKLLPKESEFIEYCPFCNKRLKRGWIKKIDGLYKQNLWCKKCRFEQEVVMNI